jgi:hypothetical protein
MAQFLRSGPREGDWKYERGPLAQILDTLENRLPLADPAEWAKATRRAIVWSQSTNYRQRRIARAWRDAEIQGVLARTEIGLSRSRHRLSAISLRKIARNPPALDRTSRQ